MARHLFGGSLADWAFTTASADGVDNLMTPAPGVDITFWNLRDGGSRHTDLQNLAGEPITSVTTSDGGEGVPAGVLPQFYGPDGVTWMWADGGAGRLLIVATDIGDLAAETAAQVGDVSDEIDNLVGVVETMQQLAYVLLLHDGVGYPVKPEGFVRAIRVGPTEPVTGVADGDIWLQPEQG